MPVRHPPAALLHVADNGSLFFEGPPVGESHVKLVHPPRSEGGNQLPRRLPPRG
jgi:hypothetical protein